MVMGVFGAVSMILRNGLLSPLERVLACAIGGYMYELTPPATWKHQCWRRVARER